MNTMEAFFDKYFSPDLSELEGLKIEGTIPLGDAVLNDFLQEELKHYEQDAPPERRNRVYIKLLQWTRMKMTSEQGKVQLTVNLHIK